MAANKMVTWVYVTKLRAPSSSGVSDGIYIAMKFAIYADMSNTSTQAYARLENCDLISRSSSALSARVSASGSIKINNAGTAYSFSTGSSMMQIDGRTYKLAEGGGNPYVTRFSSSTNIPINNTKTEFTFHMSLSMRNGESYSVDFPACGVWPVTMSGSSVINAGSVATYTLSRAISNSQNDSKFTIASWMGYAHDYNSSSQSAPTWFMYTSDSYIGPYVPTRAYYSDVTTLKYMPLPYSSSYGSEGVVCVDYYYIPSSTQNPIPETVGMIQSYSELVSPFSADSTIFYTARKFGLCISCARINLTVNNRSYVDSGLRPVFTRFDHSVYAPEGSNVYSAYQDIYSTMISRYGGIVQGARTGRITAVFQNDELYMKYRFSRSSGKALQYGSYFRTGTLTEAYSYPTKTVDLEAQMEPTNTAAWLGYVNAGCQINSFDTAGANRPITFTLRDSFGFSTTITDYITVLPYHRPNMTVCQALRCSVATGEETDLYPYNGVTYTPDESGMYALILWQIDISSLNNHNSRSLKVRLRESDAWTNLTLGSYADSGYLVLPVGSESSFDVQFIISDDFFTNVSFIAPLNTVYAMLDFKRGGTGVAMGKVSELDYVLDIHRNWLLRMPYGTYIQEYNSNGTSVNLYDWMQTVDRRITNIINSRDIMVFMRYASSGSSRWVSTNTSVVMPSGYGRIVEEHCMYVNYSGSTDIRTAAWMNNNAIRITRPYLNITLGSIYSYSGNTATQQIKYRPTIYIMTTKPTSITQSTGVPSGTIIAQKTVQIGSPDFEGLETYQGTPDTGMYIWNSRYTHGGMTYGYYFDMSSYQNRDVWVVATATCGYCPGLSWRMSEGYINVEEIYLSNSHI